MDRYWWSHNPTNNGYNYYRSTGDYIIQAAHAAACFCGWTGLYAGWPHYIQLASEIDETRNGLVNDEHGLARVWLAEQFITAIHAAEMVRVLRYGHLTHNPQF